MTPADKSLFSLIMDLVTVLIPDPRVHHSMRSQAAQRLLDARRDGWEGFDAKIGEETAPEWSKQMSDRLDAIIASLRRATAPPDAVWTPRGMVGAAPSPEPPAELSDGFGDFVPNVSIPERY